MTTVPKRINPGMCVSLRIMGVTEQRIHSPGSRIEFGAKYLPHLQQAVAGEGIGAGQDGWSSPDT